MQSTDHRHAWVLSLLAAASLLACGGGSGDSTPPATTSIGNSNGALVAAGRSGGATVAADAGKSLAMMVEGPSRPAETCRDGLGDSA